MIRFLWPIRTGITVIDYWTIAHLSFWWFIGSTLAAFRINRTLALVCCMLVAYGWELFEFFAERRWPTVWQTPESWVNSLISDPLTCLIAVLTAYYGFEHWRP